MGPISGAKASSHPWGAGAGGRPVMELLRLPPQAPVENSSNALISFNFGLDVQYIRETEGGLGLHRGPAGLMDASHYCL